MDAKILPPSTSAILEQLWDALAAAVVAGLVMGAGWIEYSKGGHSLGY